MARGKSLWGFIVDGLGSAGAVVHGVCLHSFIEINENQSLFVYH